jgi:hypothetical protein
LTVSGARCLKRAIFASPRPLNEAVHSTFETEPAAGPVDADNGRAPGNVLIALLGAWPEKHLSYEQKGRTTSEALYVSSENYQKDQAAFNGVV